MKSEKNYEKLEKLKQDYEEKHMSDEQKNRLKASILEAKLEKKRMRKRKALKYTAAAAAAMAVFVILPNTSANMAYAMSNIPVIGKLVEVVTFRDYEYDDERHQADINVPELTGETVKEGAEEINAEIRQLTDRIVKEFEEGLKLEDGYQDVTVSYEIVSTTDAYFTLKLMYYQGAGSGYQEEHYYTIDLKTGKRIRLKDLFQEGADYITPISEDIKNQMREQMKADENKAYWLEDKDIPDADFRAITDETEFYVNENDHLVISFHEGDVAPMYMGVVTFEISEDVIKNIRK